MSNKIEQSQNTTTKSKVVSVKLPVEQQTQLEQEATEKNISVSELLRQKLELAKQVTKETLPTVEAREVLQVATLDDSTLLTLLNSVAETVKNSIRTIEVDFPPVIAPEREYLRKISGLQPENENTLSIEEESYLSDLKAAITADVKEAFLSEEKSVLFPLSNNKLQVEMFEKMLERREATANEKLPSLTKIFQDAIVKAFFENANSLYNSMLFKATYGFEYSEFKAVFEL